MKEDFQNLLARLRNTGTIIGIVSATFFILQSFGVEFNLGQWEGIVQAMLSIGVTLGILNNSETPNLYIPMIHRYKDEKDKLNR
jgi:uncharacterized membrane protein